MANTKQLILTVGPQGSGKTTYAKNLEPLGYIRISQDDMGKEGHFIAFQRAVAAGHNIVVDRINHKKDQRAKYLKLAKEAGYSCMITLFTMSEEECLERMTTRWKASERGERSEHATIKSERQARSALYTFFSGYEEPNANEEGVGLFVVASPKETKPKAIIVDLDGTLCNTDHRQHFVDNKDWAGFFDALVKDEPNEWCKHLVFMYLAEGYEILFVSGRPQNYEHQTREWLDKHLGISYKLMMRKAFDYRKDSVVKGIIYDFNIKHYYDVEVVIDDRKSVVEMWRKRGLTVLQCAEGDF